MNKNVEMINQLIQQESLRQDENIQLIASENYVSQDILNAQGSILTNKYAEGYPNRRYYGGCEIVDLIEQKAIDLAKEMFNTDYHANVQPHSGTSANMAVLMSQLQPGDTILAMELNHGGHLTHGHKLSSTGKLYNIIPYGVDSVNNAIDYDLVHQLALEHKPKLIICGASAYSLEIDFERFAKIAKDVDAILMGDIAHISGLVIAGEHMSPFGHCDFVTTTTHKTLRGPRGGLILCREKFAKSLNLSVFPGIQGGPLEHVIAAKAICFAEALTPEFKAYQNQVVRNAHAMTEEFKRLGYKVVSNKTQNHLIIVDTASSVGITGEIIEKELDRHNITLNKNTIPFDTNPPMKPSGIRLGTPAMTTKGYKEEDFVKVVQKIDSIIRAIEV